MHADQSHSSPPCIGVSCATGVVDTIAGDGALPHFPVPELPPHAAKATRVIVSTATDRRAELPHELTRPNYPILPTRASAASTRAPVISISATFAMSLYSGRSSVSGATRARTAAWAAATPRAGTRGAR